MKKQSLCFLILLLLATSFAFAQEDTALTWPEVQTTHRPGTYWWWPGIAVDPENITFNLEAMREAGMGGATIVPIYGVMGYEDRFIDFLSPEYLEMVTHAVKEADRLGMWLDMTTGTGWPFGGPMVTDKEQDARAEFVNGKLSVVFSGRNVKRAAPGGEGRALNPFSPEAMTAYLKHFEGIFAGYENLNLPRAQYHDSFEYKGNWSPGLLEAFHKLRGYDLTPHLPLLFGDEVSDRVARIKADYRETLSDLHLEYIQRWVAWAADNGCTTRNQAHGASANLLDLYAAAGIPETETFGATRFDIPGVRFDPAHVSDMGPPQPLINRMAASAAHVTGKPLVAAETVTWLRNHFRATLSQAKPEVDQLFLNGINHIFFHGTCYSPKEAPWPGWLFYASFQYNPHNAIWRDASALNAYITRCQSILQSGEPDNDVALYWPVYDLWHDPQGLEHMLTVHDTEWFDESTFGDMARWLQERGYGFDYLSDRQLEAGLGSNYRTVLVPRTEYLPVETLRSFQQLDESGTPVIFVDALPRSVPGYYQWQERESTLGSLLSSRKWMVLSIGELDDELVRAGAKREPMKKRGLDFIRRTHDEGYHYFIANMGSQSVDRWIRLGTSFRSALIMDPQTGKVGLAPSRQGDEIYLQLQPGETRILRTLDRRRIEGPSWPVLHATDVPPLQIKGEWQVDFTRGQPALPASFTTEILGSWTASGDPEAERFAGTARYRIEFELPAGEADTWILDLGDVRESARVRMNGKFAGILFSAPFCLEVGEFLQTGTNVLEIEVTNLSANRIRDLDIRGVDWKIFHNINFVDHLYEEFDASGWKLTPSGLLGPVTLQPMLAVKP